MDQNFLTRKVFQIGSFYLQIDADWIHDVAFPGDQYLLSQIEKNDIIWIILKQ